MIGTRLAHYEITSHLGSGGMGEVYQATDTKLGRMVAIKVLPEAFARDADRVARFEREARMLATLNHPNIAAIYGFEQSDRGHFVVMELVGGPTLAERIKQGGLPIEEALPIARQICEALEAAHEKGVIHRDLKPANIKVLPDNTVKILDFGLAKLIQAQAAANPSVSNSPTLSMAATNAGVILGTAAYMSPEQAKGRVVDRRADIFAFGCVLYEMLTGRPAFDGEDVTEILARVVTREPDWDQLPTTVPKRVRELLRLCLQKDIKKRQRDAGDLILDIDQASAEPVDVSPVLPVKSRWRSRLVWIGAVVVALVILDAAVYQLRSVPAPEEMRLDITARAMRYPAQFAFSPDGLSVVYSASADGAQRLWLRRLDRVEAQPLPGTEGGGLPFWSPDSRSIGFFASNKLLRLDLDRGPPRPLTEVVLASGGAWNKDGVILFARSLVSPLFRIPASGGEAVALTNLAGALYPNRTPRFLPDGKHFLYWSGAPDAQGIYLGSLDGNPPKRLTAADAHAEYVEPGYVAFISQGVLLARRLDLERGELTGPTQTIADSVPYTAAIGVGAFSVSANGRIAYQVGTAARRQLVWYDRKGTAKPAAQADANELQSAELSPDGGRVALDRTVQGNRDIFLLDLVRGNMTRFTFHSAQDGLPVWSPDSKRVVFESRRKGPYDIYLKMASGSDAERPLLESSHDKWPMDWSKDGSYIMYYENDPSTGGNLLAMPMNVTDQKPVVIANSPFEERDGQFSPDGRWVAYETNESRRFEIVVQSFPTPTAKWQVSTNGGSQPRWRRDGNELYFIGADSKLMAVPIKISGSNLQPAMPVALFETRIPQVPKPQYSVSADGRFLVNQQVEDPAANSITLILNWHPERGK